MLVGNDAVSIYFKKTKNTTGKTVTKAITSTGTYKLNNSKKTASFISPAKKDAASLTIPDTISANGATYKVTEIKSKACKGMKKLTKLTIGKNVTKIGASAFENCAKLKTVTIKNAKMKQGGFGSKCFSKIKGKATFKVPKKMVKKYQEWIIKKGKAPKNIKVKGK